MADCTKCANRNNDYCIFSCENGESFKPITKADRIRTMTDEELAEFLDLVRGNKDYPLYYTDWLEWLKKEGEEKYYAKAHRD